jgi:Tol biopolymer transport system component
MLTDGWPRAWGRRVTNGLSMGVAVALVTACSASGPPTETGRSTQPSGAVTTGGATSASPATSSAPPGGAAGTAAAGRDLIDPSAWLVVDGNHLTITHPDGSGEHVAAPTVDVAGRSEEVVYGDWSPDGTHLAFTELTPGDPDTVPSGAVWTVRADGADAKQVVSCGTRCHLAAYAAWSPTGDELAYTVADYDPATKAFSRSSIEVVTLATGSRRTVAQVNGGKIEYVGPRWSPDGRRLVVEINRFPSSVRGRDDTAMTSIATLNSSGPASQAPQPLTRGLQAASPDWSWKTNTILFSINSPGYNYVTRDETALYTAKPDGSQLRKIRRFPAPEVGASPAWMPDGNIVFIHCSLVPACFVAYASADGTRVETPQKLTGSSPRVQPSS